MKCWNRFGTDGRRKMMKSRLTKSWKSWIWDKYLPENMKWKFGNKTKKRRNEDMKTEMKSWRNEEMKSAEMKK